MINIKMTKREQVKFFLYFIVVAEFPKQDEQLLEEVDFFARTWQKRLCHGIVEKTTKALENEAKVLFFQMTKTTNQIQKI